jgi:hypothetical protein
MAGPLAGVMAVFLGLGLRPDVTKEDVIKLLSAHESEATILAYIRKNAPTQILSAQDLTDLAAAGASDAVLQQLLATPTPAGAETPGYVLEAPPYYPYYYDYYSNYYPYIYTYPTFSFFFYNPFYYRHHFPERFENRPYSVRAFPYYTHPGWSHHPNFPYHPFDGHGYHPWHDSGVPGSHGIGPVREGAGAGGHASSGGHH